MLGVHSKLEEGVMYRFSAFFSAVGIVLKVRKCNFGSFEVVFHCRQLSLLQILEAPSWSNLGPGELLSWIILYVDNSGAVWLLS